VQESHYWEELVRPRQEVAAVISAEVRKFATDKDLKWEAWHQNEPIWYVWQEEHKDDLIMMRTVQVAAFAIKEEAPVLKAIPFAQIVNEKSNQAQVLDKPREVPGMVLSEVPGSYLKVYSLLQQAWEAAQTITITDFPSKKVKLSPRPGKWPP